MPSAVRGDPMLMESRVDFVCADFPAANRLTIHVLTAVAEHEANMISPCTKACLAAAKSRGVKLGTAMGDERHVMGQPVQPSSCHSPPLWTQPPPLAYTSQSLPAEHRPRSRRYPASALTLSGHLLMCINGIPLGHSFNTHFSCVLMVVFWLL